jgi:hypothetical protein
MENLADQAADEFIAEYHPGDDVNLNDMVTATWECGE